MFFPVKLFHSPQYVRMPARLLCNFVSLKKANTWLHS